MKKWLCLVCLMVLCAGCALADQAVQLPEDSRYTLLLPDDMVYDGPGKMDKASFAYVSEDLDAVFSWSDAGSLRELRDMVPTLEENGMEEVELRQVAGLEMIVYRYIPDDPEAMQCIGYIFRDGNRIQEIAFWYATQDAADRTVSIMESIE